MGGIDAKAKAFQDALEAKDVEPLKASRQAAKAEKTTHARAVEQMDQALRGAPDRGKGVD